MQALETLFFLLRDFNTYLFQAIKIRIQIICTQERPKEFLACFLITPKNYPKSSWHDLLIPKNDSKSSWHDLMSRGQPTVSTINLAFSLQRFEDITININLKIYWTLISLKLILSSKYSISASLLHTDIFSY